MQPNDIKIRKKLTRKLGIKSSITKPQSAFAALYLIWKACDQTDYIEYCNEAHDGQETLKISNAVYDKVHSYWDEFTDQLPDNFKETIEASPLFNAQVDHLHVLLTLFWKLAKIDFLNEHSVADERTGRKRFLRKIEFSSNMDLIDFTLTSVEESKSNQATFNLLWSWLSNSEEDSLLALKLQKHLSILSEDTWFKYQQNTFLQEGIYEALLNSQEPINYPDSNKIVGPLRILNSVISNGIHPTLKKIGAGYIFNEDRKDEKYIKRISNYLDIYEVNSDLDNNNTNSVSAEDNVTEFPRNLILYGAPGTGKSYKLQSRIETLNPTEYERITFYSDYSYAQFIGGYRPVPVYVSKEEESVEVKNQFDVDLNRPGQPAIEYSFVAGPLMRLYVEAKKNPQNTYLLVIEELNRADAAAVFGDFFQLLDRKPDGTSEYKTQLTKEAKQYLEQEFEGYADLKDEPVCLPANLFIWATLNSADQGVFPIDTAFKRRWEFEYLPLNENQNIVSAQKLTLKIVDQHTGGNVEIFWNELRNKINEKLFEIGIQEDLMIGPFFLSAQEMINDTAFKYKLLAYLRDDILRHQYHEFFKVQGTLDSIIRAYESGDNVFNFELS